MKKNTTHRSGAFIVSAIAATSLAVVTFSFLQRPPSLAQINTTDPNSPMQVFIRENVNLQKKRWACAPTGSKPEGGCALSDLNALRAAAGDSPHVCAANNYNSFGGYICGYNEKTDKCEFFVKKDCSPPPAAPLSPAELAAKNAACAQTPQNLMGGCLLPAAGTQPSLCSDGITIAGPHCVFSEYHNDCTWVSGTGPNAAFCEELITGIPTTPATAPVVIQTLASSSSDAGLAAKQASCAPTQQKLFGGCDPSDLNPGIALGNITAGELPHICPDGTMGGYTCGYNPDNKRCEFMGNYLCLPAAPAPLTPEELAAKNAACAQTPENLMGGCHIAPTGNQPTLCPDGSIAGPVCVYSEFHKDCNWKARTGHNAAFCDSLPADPVSSAASSAPSAPIMPTTTPVITMPTPVVQTPTPVIPTPVVPVPAPVQQSTSSEAVQAPVTETPSNPGTQVTPVAPLYEDTVETLMPVEEEVPVTVSVFKDVGDSTELAVAANYLNQLGIVGGFADGTLMPTQLLNRAEVSKFLTIARYNIIPNIADNHAFKDVPNGQWYSSFVRFANQMGIIEGYSDGTFRPQNPVNTAEFLKMLSLTYELKTNLPNTYVDVTSQDWYAPYAGIAQADKMPLGGEKCFTTNGTQICAPYLDGAHLLTRGEFVMALYHFLTTPIPASIQF